MSSVKLPVDPRGWQGQTVHESGGPQGKQVTLCDGDTPSLPGWLSSVSPPPCLPTLLTPCPPMSEAECLPRDPPASPPQGSLAQVAVGQGTGLLPWAAGGPRLDSGPHGRSCQQRDEVCTHPPSARMSRLFDSSPGKLVSPLFYQLTLFFSIQFSGF